MKITNFIIFLKLSIYRIGFFNRKKDEQLNKVIKYLNESDYLNQFFSKIFVVNCFFNYLERNFE